MAAPTAAVAVAASPPPASTPLSSAVNLLNNVIGAGLFSMPWCLAQSSVVTGSLVFAAVCALNAYSFVLLARCCSLAGRYSYLDIGKAALGARFGVLAQATATLYAAGSLVSYAVLTCDILLGERTGILALLAERRGWPFLQRGGLAARLAVGFGFSVPLLLPLSLLRSLDSLKFSSWLALIATLFAGFITFYELAAAPDGSLTPAEAATGSDQLRATVVWASFPLATFSAVPIINVAFCAHYNAPRYFFELKARSISRFALVSGGALLGALLVYLSVGMTGYLAFGSATAGDVLENFADAYPLAVGARGALLVVLVSCYPKVQHSVRDSLLRLCTGSRLTTDAAPCGTLAPVTVGIVACATLLGTVVDRVEVVLAYKGAIFGSLLVYIWPAMMHTALTLQPGQRAGGGANKRQNGIVTSPFLLPANGAERELTEQACGCDRAGVPLEEASPPPAWGTVVRAMLTTGNHVGPALLLVWGVATGVLGVAVTIGRQV